MIPQERPEATLHLFKQETLVLFLCLVLLMAVAILRSARCAGATGRILQTGFKININEACWEELLLLSGLGPGKAQAVVARREKLGPFENREDLESVKGISAGLAKKIESQIVFK